jgi:acylaminoacyl-peptidase
LDVLDNENEFNLTGRSLFRPNIYVDFKAADGPLEWTQLTSITLATSMKTDLETFQCPDETEYESLLVCRNAEVLREKMPLIVYPHGGPHRVSADRFRREVFFLNQLGFAVLFVKYSGSTGFGDKSLNTLLGKVGTQNVQEVHQAAVKAL